MTKAEQSVADFRTAVIKHEAAWSELMYQVEIGGNVAAARINFESAVMVESRAVEELWQHMHMIDCCSNGE